jgi:multidrug transporter EmrE-like cation transporter
MAPASLTLIISSVLLSAAGQVFFKIGVGAARVQDAMRGSSWNGETLLAYATSVPILAGLILYMVATVLWLQALSRIELSQAYPFFGLGFILTAVLGVLIFNDSFSLLRFCGTSLVIAGVYLVAIS